MDSCSYNPPISYKWSYGPLLVTGGPGAHFVCDMRPENIQMLPRIHIFQGTALNETDLCGISSLESMDEELVLIFIPTGMKHNTEVAMVPGF